MKPPRPLMIGTALLVLCHASLLARANEGLESDDPTARGYAIAKRADESDAGFGSSAAQLTMTLSDSRGRETTRELRIETLEKQGDGNGDWSLTRFFSPPDVEGTKLLSQARVLKSDNQWLYLPALRRVKRISSSNKSGPFVGSEFAFEDLTSNELGKYEYIYLGEEDLDDGSRVYKVQCNPLYERSGYTKLNCYFDTETFQSRRIEFFDRGGRLLKTLDLLEYRRYPKGYWRSHHQIMVNHLTRKTTTLQFGEFDFGVELERRDFDPSALETP
ncbi:MAG: outer membrane lipoprotein-sorting protein [Acidobacteriota bacterium]